MKILLVGAGGREDTLAWALSQHPRDIVLHACPGSSSIGRRATRIDLSPSDVGGIARHAIAERYDLVIVGPETPLVLGLADRVGDAGIPVFGPRAAAARLEGSKAFSKSFMDRHRIPTAAWRRFDDAATARRWFESVEARFPLVVKADGLAAGKGVVIADDRATAIAAADEMLSGRAFGSAGIPIIVEECLVGREASFFAICDGERALPLATCEDFKRIGDGDRGPNTGGMGSRSPAPHLDDALSATVLRTVVQPTLAGLAADGQPFRGVLYVGLMLTADGLRVLEFNVRFGDPETQVLIPRLDGDWLETFADAAAGRLSSRPLRWHPNHAVCVVLASEGYPGPFKRGLPIEGIDQAESMADVLVFHSGTRRVDGRWWTDGGRVVSVTASGPEIDVARTRVYAAVERIHWPGAQWRRDIASERNPDPGAA